jgi:hypothetical protein
MPTEREVPKALEQFALEAKPPDWVVDMHDHFNKTGSFRPVDVARVIGDQTKGVSMPSDDADATMFSSNNA